MHDGGQPLYPYLVRRGVSAERRRRAAHAARARRDRRRAAEGRRRAQARRAARRSASTSVLDLLTTYPRRWVDRTNEARVARPRAGHGGARARLRALGAQADRCATGGRWSRPSVGDGTGRLHVVFFNQPWRERQLAPGPADRPVRQGRRVPRRAADDEPDRRPDRRPHRAHRADLPAEREGPADARGRSPAGSRTRSSGAGRAASPTRCPTAVRAAARAHRPRRRRCATIHLPEIDGREGSRRGAGWRSTSCCACRLVLVMRKRALERDARRHPPRGRRRARRARFHAALPFPLTGAQRRVIAEIDADLAGAAPDAPAAAGRRRRRARRSSPSTALLTAVQGGHQGALMAPTEVLAEQHATERAAAARRARRCPTPTTCSATGRCASSC